MEDIIDFVNDTLKIDYSNMYYSEFKKDILDVIFNDLDLDKYKMYEETNWYKFLDKIINENEYEFDDEHINYFLGVMYFNGYRVEQNYEKAFGYYTKAIEKDNTDAMNNLGHMYRCGLGYIRDYEKAFEYFKKASEKGNHHAMNNLGNMYDNSYGFYYGIKTDRKKAFECYKKASEKGNIDALVNLGHMHYFNRIVYEKHIILNSNYEKAFEYYKLASDKGSLDGMANLANMYRRGEGIEQNYKTAIKLYKQIYKKDNIVGYLIDIGHIYEENNKLLKSIKYYNLCDIRISKKIQYFKDLFIKLSKSELRNKVNIKLYETMCIDIKQLFIKKVVKQINKRNTTMIYYEAIKDGLHKYNEKNKTFTNRVSTKQKNLLQKLKGKNIRLSKYISLLIFDFIY